MWFSRISTVAVVVLASVASSCTKISMLLDPAQVTLATGIPGGLYHPVGNAICRMFNLPSEDQPIPCVAVRSDGSVANVRRIQNEETTFALSQTDLIYAAFHGVGPFAAGGPDPNLRILIALYPEAFTIVAHAESSIRDFRDLRGKRIGIGKWGAGNTFTRDVLLQYFDWTISDRERLLELSAEEQNRALCSNKVDAIIFAAGHPDGLTQEATASCHARLVRVVGPEIDRLLVRKPYYVASIIPGGIYDENRSDVPTFGTRAVLITTNEQPEDLAYAVVKAVLENFADFQRLHPALSTLNVRDMVPSEAVMPIHPGALRYYRKAGLL